MSTQLEINNIIANSGNFVTGLTINGSGVSIGGHTHTSANITDFNVAVTGVTEPLYAKTSHTHTSANITNFNSSVSGLLPITNITAGSGISISSSSGNYTIANTEIVPHIFLLMGG